MNISLEHLINNLCIVLVFLGFVQSREKIQQPGALHHGQGVTNRSMSNDRDFIVKEDFLSLRSPWTGQKLSSSGDEYFCRAML